MQGHIISYHCNHTGGKAQVDLRHTGSLPPFLNKEKLRSRLCKVISSALIYIYLLIFSLVTDDIVYPSLSLDLFIGN